MSQIESEISRAEAFRAEAQPHADTYLDRDPGAVLVGVGETADWKLAYRTLRAVTERTLAECISPDERAEVRRMVREMFDRPGQRMKLARFWEDMDEDRRNNLQEIRTASGLIIPG